MATYAQRVLFGPFYSSGTLVTSPKIYHYVTGTTTDKDVYTTRDKGTTAAQPFVGDSNGVAMFYADGLYKFVIKDSSDNTLFTWDAYDVTEAMHLLEATIVWDPANLVDGAGETSSGITVTGAAFGDYVLVGAPYDLQGITCTAYVSAADTVKIRLQNETGGAINLASGTWKVRVLQQ
jgi:hypothetical protein